MASLMKPYSDGGYVIGPGQAFFIVPSPAPERGISVRRRRRLRGRRKADLRAAGLPPDGIVLLGDVSLALPRYPDPERLVARQAETVPEWIEAQCLQPLTPAQEAICQAMDDPRVVHAAPDLTPFAAEMEAALAPLFAPAPVRDSDLPAVVSPCA